MTFAVKRAKQISPLTLIVRNMTPNWFTTTMGTGALSLTLAQFPVVLPGLKWLAVGLWLANIVLFLLISLLYAAHWVMFFREAQRILAQPVMSMFLGAIPMGLATIINGFLMFGYPVIGTAAVSIAHVLWWFDVAMSLACSIAVPYVMFTRQEHSIEKLTAVWLLPIVACEVAAVSAGLLAPHLDSSQGFLVVILGYVLWAFSVPLAMGILVLLFLRLALHKLPEREMGVSAWLALGPIGTGALGLVVLGGSAQDIFTENGLADVGGVAFGLGLIGGVIFWGYGAWWLVLAILKTIRYLRDGLPFNLGWWGFTFPLGVYCLSTLALAHATGLEFFAAMGGLFAIGLALLWTLVASRTFSSVWKDGLILMHKQDIAGLSR